MAEWISIKSAQPVIHKEVLLHYLDGTILIGCRFRFGYLNEQTFGKVTHWRALPSPPTK